jgi:hypothetical protein
MFTVFFLQVNINIRMFIPIFDFLDIMLPHLLKVPPPPNSGRGLVTKPSTHRPLGDTSKIIAGVYNRKGIEFC